MAETNDMFEIAIPSSISVDHKVEGEVLVILNIVEVILFISFRLSTPPAHLEDAMSYRSRNVDLIHVAIYIVHMNGGHSQGGWQPVSKGVQMPCLWAGSASVSDCFSTSLYIISAQGVDDCTYLVVDHNIMLTQYVS